MNEATKWKLMPSNASYQMMANGLVACPVFGLSINAMPLIYRAMYEAAPTPPFTDTDEYYEPAICKHTPPAPEVISMEPVSMKIGGKYNWIGQTERLVFIGRNFSGNGYWNQFEKIDSPRVVWCEVLDSDLHMIEETPMAEQLAHLQARLTAKSEECERLRGERGGGIAGSSY